MKRIILILPILFLIFTHPSFAQWEKLNSAPSGNSNAIYETDNRLYVNSESDIYYAENNGQYQWKLLPPPKEFLFYTINDIIEVDNTIYVATNFGLYYTSNNGEEWKKESFTGLADKKVNVHDLEYTNNTFFAIASTDIFVSKDKGWSWNNYEITGINITPTRMIVKDSVYILARQAPNYNCRICLSIDYGESWQDITTGVLPDLFVLDATIVDSTIFIASSVGIYKSSIYNIEWKSVYYSPCGRLCYDGANLYGISSSFNLIYSSDMGLNWEQSNPEGLSPVQHEPTEMYYNQGNIIYLTTAGLIKTSDFGETWSEANNGFCSLMASDMVIKDSDLYLARRGSGLYSSSDIGKTWIDLNKSMSSYQERDIMTLCITDDAIYTGGFSRIPMRVTRDNAETWSNFSSELPLGWYQYIKEYNDYLFILYTYMSSSYLFRATKVGNNIDTIKYHNSTDFKVGDLIASNEGIFVTTYQDGVLYSEDNGDTWQCISDNLSETSCYSLAYSNEILYVGTATGNIYSTSDIGQNWDLFYESSNDSCYISLMKVKDDNLFFVTLLNAQYFDGDFTNPARGLHFIKTNGEHHADITYNILNRYIGKIGFMQDTLIVSSGGLYKMPISEIERLSVDVDIRGDYLYAFPPYPTPANQEVNVKIYWDAVLGLEYADMAVYDLVGNRICGKEALQINRTGSWNAIVTWNSSGVVPGVYFLIVKHGMKSRCIKFLIE